MFVRAAALSTSRFGADVEFETSIGRDPVGDEIRAYLSSAGVDLVPGSLENTSTFVAEARIAADGSADYRFDVAWDPQAFRCPVPLPVLKSDHQLARLSMMTTPMTSAFSRPRIADGGPITISEQIFTADDHVGVFLTSTDPVVVVERIAATDLGTRGRESR